MTLKDTAPVGVIPLDYYTATFTMVRQDKDPSAYVIPMGTSHPIG